MSIEIHHLAAISGDLQKTIDFYHNVLGLKCIRKATLFDGPKVCHFYWGKSIENFITFYHCPGLYKTVGNFNASGTISFLVNKEARQYWSKRLCGYGIRFVPKEDELERCDTLNLRDPDGLAIKLIFSSQVSRSTNHDDSFFNYAIKGIYGIEIASTKLGSLSNLFVDKFKMNVEQRSINRYRFFGATRQGSVIDLDSGIAHMDSKAGYGRIHHIALKIHNWQHFLDLRDDFGYENQHTIFKKHPNNYSAMYFWNDGDLLFEIVGQRTSAFKASFLNLMQHIPDIPRKSQVR